MPSAVRKRYLFTLLPIESHLRRLVDVALSLLNLGHTVLIASPASLAHTVTQTYGLPHVAAGEDWMADNAVAARLVAVLLQHGNDAFCRALLTEYVSGPPALTMARDVIRIAKDFRPHAVVHEPTELGGYLGAAKSGVPDITVDNGFARVVDHYRAEITPNLDRHREALRLSPEPDKPETLALLTPAPADLFFPDHAPPPRVYGYRPRQPERAGERLPYWMTRFPLDRQLIYVSFGSIISCSPPFIERTTDAFHRIVAAVNELGCAAVVSVSPSISRTLPRHPHIRYVRRTPQPLLLQAGVSAFVNHGALGSLVEALALRVPMVNMPICSDGPRNARRWHDLKLGVSLGLDAPVADICDALAQVLTDPQYAANALRWQRRMLALPPLTSVVAQLTH